MPPAPNERAAAPRRAWVCAPDDPAAGATLAASLEERGEVEAAMTLWRRLVRLNPDRAAAAARLGALLWRCDAPPEAELHLRRALALAPGHEETLFHLAMTLHAAQRPAAAAAVYRALLALRPTMAEAAANLGVALYDEGRLAAAVASVRRAIRIRPGEPDLYRLLSRILLTAGEPAAAAARRGLAFNPADADAQAVLERARRYDVAAGLAAAPPGGAPAGLAVHGAFRDASGYAHMVRHFVRHLAARGERIMLTDGGAAPAPRLGGPRRDPFFETLDRPVRARSLLNFTLPTMAERIPGLPGILFSMFEGRRIPDAWLAHTTAQALLITPTRSSAEAWIAAGFPEDRIRLCPLGVTPVSVPPLPADAIDPAGRRLSAYRTRILNIADFSHRKNLTGLIRVWLKATSAEDDAALLLKPGKAPAGDPAIWRLIDLAARDLGKPASAAAPIFPVQGVLGDGEMLSLFAAATHYWSMSHGEGWDLPMTQAGAMGLRLIAPDHSAYRAYLTPDVAALIPARPVSALKDYRRLPLPDYYPPYAACCTMEWWEPDEDAAAAAVVDAIRGADPPRSARDRLLNGFNWTAATTRLQTILRETGAL